MGSDQLNRYIDNKDNAIDFSDQSAFDHVDALFPAFQGSPRYQAATLERDRGSIAWGAALVARSYLVMYKSTSDERFLRKFVGHAEQILLSRDSITGLKDYRGISGPVWSSGRPYSTNYCSVGIVNSTNFLYVRSKSATQIEIYDECESFGIRFLDNSGMVLGDYDNLNLMNDSPRFVSKVLSDTNWKQPLPAARLKNDSYENSTPIPGIYDLKESYYVAAVETGQICGALLEFSSLINTNPALSQYKDYADKYLLASIKALDFHRDDLRSSPYGQYLDIQAEAPHDFEGTDAPLNHNTSIARCYVILYSITRDNAYRTIANDLLSHFKASLSLRDTAKGQAYIWPYFSVHGVNYNGHSPSDNISKWRLGRKGYPRLEDISHAIISIEASIEASKQGIAFDNEDLIKFANTLVALIKISSEKLGTLSNYVDGTGGYDKYLSAIGRWSILAPWNQSIWEFCRNTMNQTQPNLDHATVILGLATLNSYKNTQS
ncbi:hypothetical protein [Glutamicibacter ardleyensis]|uniref:hypothetical protein n=1 Tax=Glutamicibacter ardleyensis TaxID=225894 RepID=UPI003FD22043